MKKGLIVRSFIELGALFQKKPEPKASMPIGTVTNQYGIRAELKSYEGMTLTKPQIPLRKF